MWVLGIGVWGGTLWFEASRDIKCIQDEYAAALARYTPGELDKPAHKVTIPRPFYMSRYEVTAGQYRAIVPGLRYTTISSSHPVEGVTWDEAKRFCTLLENRLGRKVRLPTEAEWEYACRANTKTTFYCGDDYKALDGVAWYNENSDVTAHAVGGKRSNAFNLFDMHGNALEWVEDDFHFNYIGAPSDGSAWIDKPRASARVVRGGCWYDSIIECGSAYRYGVYTQDYCRPVGFRVVIEMR
jgi:formylglycine-generating enzyme required for sulfatase activity